ncbi:hypothetical protein Dimus_006306, partial [Dionaea muscipula]
MQAPDQGIQTEMPASGAELGQIDRRTVRRRLVQSTLFPLKPRENKEENCKQKEVNNCVEVDDQEDEDEEYCGSQGKRKKTQNERKKKKQEQLPRKSRKVAANGRTTPIKPMIQRDSPGVESPQPLKEKQKVSRRNGRINGFTGPCLEKVPTSPLEHTHVSQPIPDLRLEAKLSAEESSRLFAGREMHPLFSQWKVGKSNPENYDPESNCGMTIGKDKHFNFGPIHVFEDIKDNLGSVDWSDWNFCDGTFSKTICRETTRSSLFDDFVGSLCFDEIHEDLRASKLGFISHDVGCINSIVEENAVLQERMKSYLNRSSQPENSLWTCKYQPEKAMQVCGVDDSSDGESDSEYMEEASVLKNVLLVTGPVGSGKSAAIYACAKEQGFNVIEVNASDWRNGALVKEKFGEAVESHWLIRRQETPFSSQSKRSAEPSALSIDGAAMQEFENGVIELIAIPDDEDCTRAFEIQKEFDFGDGAIDSDHGKISTLILFEEVDATLCEDRGFVSTIQLLANTGKRPMILTANSENPILPHNLVREEVLFRMPSLRELLFHVNMVCAAEKAEIQPHIIGQYIQYCKCDIRKLLMHLQFWCQGKGIVRDRKLKQLYKPLLFDVEAGHRVLPKLIPWGLHSQLAEAVEREIAKSLSKMVENHSVSAVPMEETDNCSMENDLNGRDGVRITMEAKKEEILRRNRFADDNEDLIAPVVNACKVSSSSGSPVAFSRRIARSRTWTVLSSCSEDEVSNKNLISLPRDCVKDDGDELISEVDSQFLIHHPALDDSLCLSVDLLPNAEEAEMEKQQQCSERTINDECQSVGISCVPESTIIPETEVNDGIELPSTADQTEAISPVVVGSSNKVIFAVDEVSKCALGIDLNLPCVEMGDSFSGEEDSVNCARDYPVMDECSRIDFCRGGKSLKKCRSRSVVSSVQETWNELRLSDLRLDSTLEHKDASQMVELAYRMSSLISDADMLLSSCQSPTSDDLDERVDVSEEAFYFSWHNQHVRMASDVAEHGYCLHATEAAALASKIGIEDRVDLAGEMLVSTSSANDLGKYLRTDSRSQTSFAGGNLKVESSVPDLSFR